jgi:hypothetical protein
MAQAQESSESYIVLIRKGTYIIAKQHRHKLHKEMLTFTQDGRFFMTYFRPSSSKSVNSRTVAAKRDLFHALIPAQDRNRTYLYSHYRQNIWNCTRAGKNAITDPMMTFVQSRGMHYVCEKLI